MEVNPRIDWEEIEWTERVNKARQENKKIMHTLDNVRFYFLYRPCY